MIGTKKWGLKMFLVIYKKGNKLYFNTVKRLTEKFTVTNEKFETVKLGYNNKIRSFKFDGWEDFKRIREELRKYSLRMYVACVRYPNKREIKLVLELMKNPFYNIMIEEYINTIELTEYPEIEVCYYNAKKNLNPAELLDNSFIKTIVFRDEKEKLEESIKDDMTNLLSIILLSILTVNSSFADGFKDD